MIESKWLKGTEGLEIARIIRQEVFVDEQEFPESEEYDEIDKTCEHLIVYDNSKPIATGRFYIKDDTYIPGRIAVIKEMRSKGIGDLVVKLLLYRGINLGAKKFKISAQVYAQGFYERYGFKPVGDIYNDCHVPHINMTVNAEDVKFPTKCNKKER